MTDAPRIVIGVPLYNRADYLAEALESLLSQTYRRFALLLVDDGSVDGTEGIARKYAALDGRITYTRNESRLGMIGNWRKAFDLADRSYPTAEYFAWASDHDLWHPRWLGALVAELDRHPRVGVAYPQTLRLSDRGDIVKGPWSFDTFGIARPDERLRLAARDMRAGDMIYGLFRKQLIQRIGGFPWVLLPDRLLLSHAAIYAQFKQVPEVLWYRRFAGLASLQRQRAAFFPDGVPLSSFAPPRLMHVAHLAWHLALLGEGLPDLGRAEGARLAGICALGGAERTASRRASAARKAVRRGNGRLRATVGRRRRRLRSALRGWTGVLGRLGRRLGTGRAALSRLARSAPRAPTRRDRRDDSSGGPRAAELPPTWHGAPRP